MKVIPSHKNFQVLPKIVVKSGNNHVLSHFFLGGGGWGQTLSKFSRVGVVFYTGIRPRKKPTVLVPTKKNSQKPLHSQLQLTFIDRSGYNLYNFRLRSKATVAGTVTEILLTVTVTEMLNVTVTEILTVSVTFTTLFTFKGHCCSYSYRNIIDRYGYRNVGGYGYRNIDRFGYTFTTLFTFKGHSGSYSYRNIIDRYGYRNVDRYGYRNIDRLGHIYNFVYVQRSQLQLQLQKYY